MLSEARARSGRSWVWLAAYAAAAIVLPPFLGCASALMLPADLATPMTPPDLPQPGRRTSVSVVNERGHRLEGALYTWPGDRGTVLASGGNAMSRSATERYTRFLHREGFRVLVFSFQGYDQNGGAPDLESLPTDAAAFHRLLRNRYPSEGVVYLASSISTVAAQCLPALEPDVRGLILEGAVDAPRIGFAKVTENPLLWPLLPVSFPLALGVALDVPKSVDPRTCFATPAMARVPALYLHHPDDAVVPYSGARDLFERYPGQRRFIDLLGAGQPPAHLLLTRDARARSEVVRFAREQLHRFPEPD